MMFEGNELKVDPLSRTIEVAVLVIDLLSIKLRIYMSELLTSTIRQLHWYGTFDCPVAKGRHRVQPLWLFVALTEVSWIPSDRHRWARLLIKQQRELVSAYDFVLVERWDYKICLLCFVRILSPKAQKTRRLLAIEVVLVLDEYEIEFVWSALVLINTHFISRIHSFDLAFAIFDKGCFVVSVEWTTWGRIKRRSCLWNIIGIWRIYPRPIRSRVYEHRELLLLGTKVCVAYCFSGFLHAYDLLQVVAWSFKVDCESIIDLLSGGAVEHDRTPVLLTHSKVWVLVADLAKWYTVR